MAPSNVARTTKKMTALTEKYVASQNTCESLSSSASFHKNATGCMTASYTLRDLYQSEGYPSNTRLASALLSFASAAFRFKAPALARSLPTFLCARPPSPLSCLRNAHCCTPAVTSKHTPANAEGNAPSVGKAKNPYTSGKGPTFLRYHNQSVGCHMPQPWSWWSRARIRNAKMKV